MRFDENPPSSNRLFHTGRRTTKVNIAMALGVGLFLLIGVVLLWYFARQAE